MTHPIPAVPAGSADLQAAIENEREAFEGWWAVDEEDLPPDASQMGSAKLHAWLAWRARAKFAASSAPSLSADGGLHAAMLKLSRTLGHPNPVDCGETQSVDAALIEMAAERLSSLSADARDAKRYQWLRDVSDELWTFALRTGFDAQNIDAAIDAAMKEQQR